MRPVNKGPAPQAYSRHGLAKSDLHDKIGNYCSYCERPYPEDVEHILPRVPYSGLEVTWSNFLVACKSCNDTKRNQQSISSPPNAAVDRAKYLWPHLDNTARAFVYARTGITVAAGLSLAMSEKAADTMKMTGFHKTPGSPTPTDSDKDHRARFREEVWVVAIRYRGKLTATPNNVELRESIADLASAKGFWSVWRTVFVGDADMLRRLNAASAGTAQNCFDPVTSNPVARPGGQL